jgi:hypothetical protein
MSILPQLIVRRANAGSLVGRREASPPRGEPDAIGFVAWFPIKYGLFLRLRPFSDRR